MPKNEIDLMAEAEKIASWLVAVEEDEDEQLD